MIDTTPTAHNLSDVIKKVHSHAQMLTKELVQAGFTQAQCDDLTQAFADRLQAVIWPEFERDYEVAKDRGFIPSKGDALEKFRESAQLFNWLKLSPIGVGKIDHIILRGPQGQRSKQLEGYVALNASVRKEQAYPIDLSSDVVELFLPVSVKTIPKISKDERETALLGLTFHWSHERDQWIPGVLKTYVRLSKGAPTNTVTSVPSTF